MADWLPGGTERFVDAVDLVAREDAPGRARSALAAALTGDDSVDRDRLDDCLLLVSEVVSNGLLHAVAGRLPLLRVIWVRRGDMLRSEVFDPSPVLPAVLKVDADEEEGRGMWLLDTVADRWAAERIPAGRDAVWSGGKVVWFVVRDVWPGSRPSRRAYAR